MHRRRRGFTLLELLVVLVILALAAAVAAPNLMKLVSSLARETRQDKIAVYLQELPVAVMREGSRRTLVKTSGYMPAAQAIGNDIVKALEDDAEGLRVWIPKPIVYRPNGACTGGVTHWELPGEARFTLALEAPLCRPAPQT